MERQFRVADPRAPRFLRKKFDILNATNKEFYTALKEQHPELSKYPDNEIARFIEFFNNVIAQEVVDNRNGVHLPNGLGIIVAGACKISLETSKTNTDYKTSAEVGQHVAHSNLHSDTYIAKVKYSNALDRHMFENNDLWMFDPCRALARAVSAQFKNGNHRNYITFTTRQHIAHLFRKQKIAKENPRAVYAKKQQLDNYDEFAFN